METQMETQTQVTVRTVRTLSVPRRVYNTIRSVVESSMKKCYYWNVPIVDPTGRVRFAKYRVGDDGLETKAWEVVVGENEGIEVLVENQVAELDIRRGHPDEPTYTLKLANTVRLEADSIYDFEFYAVVSDAPFAYPIILADFIEKLLFFVRITRRAKAQQAQSPA
jgi:hypothetical protein